MFSLFKKSSYECYSDKNIFTVKAKGFTFEEFVSNCDGVTFQFDSINTQDLTISVNCANDVSMSQRDKEFRRAVAQLHNDNGRFNIGLREQDQIITRYELHLKQCGIALNNKTKAEGSYDIYRPGGNTAC